MGSYATFTLGSLTFDWKSHYPDLLMLFFNSDDAEALEAANEDSLPVRRYRTTVRAARATANRLGYTIEFLAEIYEYLLPLVQHAVAEHIALDIVDRFERSDSEADYDSVEQEAMEFGLVEASKLAAGDRSRELVEFIPFLQQASAGGVIGPECFRVLHVKLPCGFSCVLDCPNGIDLASKFSFLDDLHGYRGALQLAHAAIVSLLDEDQFSRDIADILNLIEIRLLLEGAPDGGLVELDLTDLIESGYLQEDLFGLHEASRSWLGHRLALLHMVFAPVAKAEPQTRLRAEKKRMRTLLITIRRRDGSATEKGQLLEDLLATVFSTDGFDVVSRRVRTGDEELDLVIRNNCARPFWLSLRTPLVLVECKNWSAMVGAPILREFESKIRNRGNLCRLGFVVAAVGFSKECMTHLKRAGRDEVRIVLIDLDAIEEYARSELSLYEWLERLLIDQQ